MRAGRNIETCAAFWPIVALRNNTGPICAGNAGVNVMRQELR